VSRPIGPSERSRRGPSAQEREADVNAAFHDCFDTPAGRIVLDYLRKRYVEAPTTEGLVESALREFTGARNLVLEIERRINKGEQ
jgi:hypothetical protein